ncbi:MAG TPA: tRNA (adenosine(37)-N6)-dimethylallyltransferase MiaA [Thermotogales bacterium]|nr:tRNA (adenosine(37)-N6)-dimethylallyltransferase MiaA [Thermotogales bacterium]
MKIPIISGPTGVGKSEIAFEVAIRLDGEIISMDSMQIYKFMDIGTAKPPLEMRKQVPHHMMDIIYPDEDYNAYLYLRDSTKVMRKILSRGKLPIFVGGTGLYVDALTRGLIEIPKDENVRRKLWKLEESNRGTLRKILEDVDPEAARRIHPNDLKRTIRALEVYYKTGTRISELQKKVKPSGEFILFILTKNREELYNKINLRVDDMLKRGLIDEVKHLLDMGYDENLNSMKAIGYRETIDYIKGRLDYDKYVHVLKRNTRHYARRQLIWFRRYDDAIWLDLSVLGKEGVVEKIVEFIKRNCVIKGKGGKDG